MAVQANPYYYKCISITSICKQLQKENMKTIVTSITSILVFCVTSAQADRITLHTGDIFIGHNIELVERQYHIERFGFMTMHPQWDVKLVEAGVETLELGAATDSLKIPGYGGHVIRVESKSPLEASHLEFYPDKNYYHTTIWRYVRGYLVNRTQNPFLRIHAQFKYYNSDNDLLFWQDTEVFQSYPMTMKPFIVDTRFVPWERIALLRIVFISGKEMDKGP